ncbi:MAG: MetQ/NlpA family ABC transporter substrate-binding protein [Oscillospiraceae bacterium]|nr:MetQ/NlpA family ABC transporter substrate-binding protein [Oscillospiraceae bacterium]
MKKLFSIVLSLALTLSLIGCGGGEKANVLKVGASPSPHAEILEAAKEPLAKLGWELEIIEFTDYVQPNTALDAGDLDANFFQHTPYLNSFNRDYDTDIVSVAAVHFEPLGIYPGKSSDLTAIAEGAVIAVPNDETNEARALLLLQQEGIITLKEGAGLSATKLDIVENPYNVDIYEIEAAQTVNVLADVDFAVVNGNYAVSADILDTVLASESSEGEVPDTYANILAAKADRQNEEGIQALAQVLNSDEIRQFINEKYENLFVPVF